MNCPFCQRVCKESNEKVIAPVCGRGVRSNGAQSVACCETHGVMRIANCYTDTYMAEEYGDELVLRNGSWVPRNQARVPEPQSLATLFPTGTSCTFVNSTTFGPCPNESCRICWTTETPKDDS